jgi:nicotinamidase/pyrazinamidase
MNALLLVDIQNDFVPGGALAVPDGDQVVAVANRLMRLFPLVVATRDWHPPDHLSFASQHPGKKIGQVIDVDGLPQILWPDHCVQGTQGAELVDVLDAVRIDKVLPKGTDRSLDSYSGFFDNGHRKSTGLDRFLRESNTTDVYVMGLATDYCVLHTALDAVQLGLNTILVEDGCRGVNLRPGDVTAAQAQMRHAGVRVVTSRDLERPNMRSL